MKQFTSDRGRIHLIVGASRLGAAIASIYAREGKYVTVIDKDKDSKYKLGENFVGSFIKGDATKVATLEEADITNVKEVVVVTDDDDTNIFIATLIYKIYEKKNIVLRLADSDKAQLLPDKTFHVITPHENSLLQYDLFKKHEVA